MRERPRHRPDGDAFGALGSPRAHRHDAAGAVPDIEPLATLEERHIQRALAACGGNRTRAARTLGIALSTLERKLAGAAPVSRGAGPHPT